MSLVERLIKLKGFYAEFNKICEIQKAHFENPERPWADFPSSLISDLKEYEEIPSDELIALAVSDKYRMRDTAKTIEGERARLELSKEILCQSNWREYEFVDFVSDTGDTREFDHTRLAEVTLSQCFPMLSRRRNSTPLRNHPP